VISTSVLSGPWTFTYPSVYLAHHAITHSRMKQRDNWDNTAWFSTTAPAGIIPLHTSDIYSVHLKLGVFNGSGVDYARRVARGEFEPFLDLKGWATTDEEIMEESGSTKANKKFRSEDTYETYPFNFGDLQDPVPASLYFNGRTDCWGQQSHCATITGDTYRPRIKLKNRIWASLLPQGFDCRRLQFVDPPIRLQTMDLTERPTLHPITTIQQSEALSTTTAEPIGQMRRPWAYSTATSSGKNNPENGNVEN
jgi:hypothetical protein